MINRETTQVEGKQDIYAAFSAISTADAAYITKEELEANLTPLQVEYCLRVMPKYEGAQIPPGQEAFDYKKFVNGTFN